MEFTAIYVESWMSGSHRQYITRMTYGETLEGESIEDALDRLGILNDIVFVFKGHVEKYLDEGE